LLNDGISSYQTGDLSNAIDAFSKVLKINPSDYEATCYLARSYVGQEKYDYAIERAKKAIEFAATLNENPARAYSVIGEAYRGKKQFDLAIEAFKNSVELHKKSSTLNNLGYAYFKNKDYDNAINAFRESLDIQRNSTTCCGLGKVLLKKHSVIEALKYFQEAIVIAEESIAKGTMYVWPYYNLAFSHLVLNHQEDCLKILATALEKNRNPSVIKEQLIDYNEMKSEENVSQDLLARCLDLFNKTVEKF
jgi:tetratricopeptide (TPR) repeat protein